MIRLLLVDDESSLLEIGKIFIEKAGNFKVDTASSAEEALFMLEDESRGPYEVIVSDYGMPGKNGIEFLRELRENNNHIPFLIFTGRGREDVVVEAIESGADYYVQKGGSPKSQFAELIHKINKAVDNKKAEENLKMENLRLKAINSVLHMKDVSFKDIIYNAVSDAINISKSSFGYAVIPDESGIAAGLFCCNPACANESGSKADMSSRVIEDNSFLKDICCIKSICTEDEIKLNNIFSAVFEAINPAINRFLAVPVVENDQVVMIVVVANKKTPYDDSDRRQLELLITSMWVIASRKRTEEELIAAYGQLKASDEQMQKQLLMLRENERKLNESEESLSFAIEGAGLGIWDSDILTKKQVVNNKWAEMLGYTCEEVDNVPDFWREHVHPADLPHVLKNIQDYSLGKKDNYHSEFRMRCRDGRWKWIASTGKISEWDESGRPVRISGIHRDITDLVSAGKTLNITRKKLKQLFAVTGNDILTRLTLISGNAEVLKEMIPTDSEEQKYIEGILDSADVIGNQLDFATRYMNLGLHDPLWHNVGDIIRRSLRELDDVRFEYEESLFSVEIFADQMFYNVILNIFRNILCFSEGPNIIKVTFEEKGEFGVIFIEFTGPGISVAEDEFISVDDPEEGKGLFMAHEILSFNGIDLTKTGLNGKGIRFELRIPVDQYLFKNP